VGNVRTALFNWLFARSARAGGGVFILRIEDTDVERSEARYDEQLMADLKWLGLDWDEGPDRGGPLGPYRQSERREIYDQHTRRLLEDGHAYYCFCSEEELEAERKAALAAGQQPKYSGKCARLAPEEAARRHAAGERAAVRLRIPPEPIRFQDLVHGAMEFSHEVIGDPVLVRATGMPNYNYAVVIDDLGMKITHVIRGDDHLSNTPRQVAVYRALGAEPPQFAHLSTILGHDHTRLSKRHGAVSVARFREKGILPEALMNYLALLGWSSGNDREIFTAAELCEAFRLDQVSKSPAEFNYEKLYWLNRHHLKQADRQRVLKLAAPHFPPAAQAAPDWLAAVVDLLLPSVDCLEQLPERGALIFAYDAAQIRADAESRTVLEEPESSKVLAAFLPRALAAGDLAPRFKEVMNEVKKEAGAKGKHLFHPVRVALTGRASGPEMDKLLPLLEQGAALGLVKGPRQRLEEFKAQCQT
jgi:glutamyl-tRNA synthetase/nondiscriminating glutamyl-tRNA synthetase